MPRPCFIIDAFASERFAGNPAAVVLNADGLGDGGGLQAVPEPATVSILGAAALGALTRRTRRVRS